MILDREQLIKAIKFLKPAIFVSDTSTALCYVHVKVENETCYLTSSNYGCGKRVTLQKPPQIAFDEKETPIEDQEFLIDRDIIDGYLAILQSHKKTFDKTSDRSLKLVEIGPTELKSFTKTITHRQPGIVYPDLESQFFANMEEVDRIHIDPMVLIDVLKEFPGIAEIKFAGTEDAAYVKSGDFEAFFNLESQPGNHA